MIALKRLIAGTAVAAALAIPVLTPAPAQAWWYGGWGWHAGWGWRGGVYVGLPPVVVGAPAYPYPAYPAYPYPGYAYAGWRWVPGYWGAGHVWVGGRWVR